MVLYKFDQYSIVLYNDFRRGEGVKGTAASLFPPIDWSIL